MSKIATTGKRRLVNDTWHDDNGPLPGLPREWEPPMTDDERHVAALSDPDARPSTPEQLARFKPMALAKRTRLRLAMTQQDFADRFHIPVGTLRDWEQHRSEPDTTALAYLRVIERDHDAVLRALGSEATGARVPA